MAQSEIKPVKLVHDEFMRLTTAPQYHGVPIFCDELDQSQVWPSPLIDDLIKYGIAFERDGKRIDPLDVYVLPWRSRVRRFFQRVINKIQTYAKSVL